jgi:hypothetical protein
MQQTFKRPRISPPTVEFFPGHLTTLDVSVVYVGDFEFSAPEGSNVRIML